MPFINKTVRCLNGNTSEKEKQSNPVTVKSSMQCWQWKLHSHGKSPHQVSGPREKPFLWLSLRRHCSRVRKCVGVEKNTCSLSSHSDKKTTHEDPVTRCGGGSPTARL